MTPWMILFQLARLPTAFGTAVSDLFDTQIIQHLGRCSIPLVRGVRSALMAEALMRSSSPGGLAMLLMFRYHGPMATPDEADRAQFWRPRFLPGVELVSVAYRDRSFPEHSHAEYVIGAVSEGAEALKVEGVAHRVSAGAVLRLHPEQTHANATIGPGTLRYNVLYLPAVAIAPYGNHEAPLSFATPVTNDPALYQAVQQAHALLATDAGRLEQESALAAIVRTFGAGEGHPVRATATVAAAIVLAQDYIDCHYAEGFGLETLSALTGLSVFHLVRSFKKAIGLSPLAYRNQKRVFAARAMLLDGAPIAHVAVSVGYADQSHLTRQFQRIVGVPPGRYAQQ
jgi:AraC-like DNA-binding protein